MDATRPLSLNRRAWIFGILETAGLLVAAPTLHAAQDHTHGPLAAPAPDAHWTPQFFTPQQNQTLIALGERLVPGSEAAFCNRLIDLVMTIESKKNRDELIHVLTVFDQQSQTRYQKRFDALAPQQQDAILTAAADPHAPLFSQFVIAKEWIADTYWSSEKGLRELGWTGRVAWERFPGCGNPAAHN